uniref:Uncharacterized protein n=1 Tax=Lactuca sativa TaxID=4236 RepID=A0A9R1WXY7_LACSA|nr:hypothetical protein LSAT_V11C800449800 [Lactuca sativa]
MNYNINGCHKPISELHSMLKTVEKNIPRKIHQVLLIHDRKIKKKIRKKSNGKPQVGKGKGKKAPQSQPTKRNENVSKDDACFECGVIDNGCETHICNLLQGFRKSKELKASDMVL